jgi:dCMP deaminase
MSRISWEEYALKLAETASIRSEDPYLKVGACVLRHDNSVAGLGYNGSPPGYEIDWSDRDSRRPFVSHAERSALRYCKPGEAKLIAITLSPCQHCIMDIAMFGIKKVVFRNFYERDEKSFEIAHKFNIEMIQI